MWYFSLIIYLSIRQMAGEEENLKQSNSVNFKKLSINVNFAYKTIRVSLT